MLLEIIMKAGSRKQKAFQSKAVRAVVDRLGLAFSGRVAGNLHDGNQMQLCLPSC